MTAIEPGFNLLSIMFKVVVFTYAWLQSVIGVGVFTRDFSAFGQTKVRISKPLLKDPRLLPSNCGF